MKYLFIDTSATKLIVAIICDKKIMCKTIKDNSANLSVELLPIIDNSLKECSLDIKDINKIFVTNGPGSFTGIRIGLDVAKVIGWSMSIPVITISSLEVIASGSNDSMIVPVIDARNGNVFIAVYDNKLNVLTKDQFTNFEKFRQDLKDVTYIDTNDYNVDLLKVINKHINDKVLNVHSLKPNYLKLTEA